MMGIVIMNRQLAEGGSELWELTIFKRAFKAGKLNAHERTIKTNLIRFRLYEHSNNIIFLTEKETV